MPVLRALRYLLALLVTAVATLAIFLFMVQLISGKPLQVAADSVPVSVNIYQPPPLAEPPRQDTPPETAVTATVTEPVMAPLSVSAPAPVTALPAGGPPIPSFAPSLADVALQAGSGDILGSGFGEGNAPSRWTPSGDDALAKKIAEAEKKGAEGYREIIPFGTRQPNIPKYAWDNKIDGWVLVAFAVNASGQVENVRVLDSQPPGVFDENVIAAVQDWIYRPEDVGGRKVKIQLTQRIQLYWKDYPNNNKQLK